MKCRYNCIIKTLINNLKISCYHLIKNNVLSIKNKSEKQNLIFFKNVYT